MAQGARQTGQASYPNLQRAHGNHRGQKRRAAPEGRWVRPAASYSVLHWVQSSAPRPQSWLAAPHHLPSGWEHPGGACPAPPGRGAHRAQTGPRLPCSPDLMEWSVGCCWGCQSPFPTKSNPFFPAPPMGPKQRRRRCPCGSGVPCGGVKSRAGVERDRQGRADIRSGWGRSLSPDRRL